MLGTGQVLLVSRFGPPNHQNVTFEVEKENLAQQYIVLMMPAPDGSIPSTGLLRC